MSLDQHNKELLTKLLANRLYIAFFVHRRQYYWILDWDEHFNLDHKQNIDAVCSNTNLMQHLPKGTTIEEYRKKLLANYRGGITQLTEDNFPSYLTLPKTRILSTNELAFFFFSKEWGDFAELQKQMESFISFGDAMSNEYSKMLKHLRTLLPTFYINFDRKIFLHMRTERFYEKVAYKDWYAHMGDFEHMIPVSRRYWWRNGDEDFWAITNFHS